MNGEPLSPPRYTLRSRFVLALLLAAFAALAARAAWVQVWNKEFLQAQGEQRYQRQLKINAVRGKLLDRNGAVLALSTPVDSVWAHPGEFAEGGVQPRQWAELARRLEFGEKRLRGKLERGTGRGFVYLKRHLAPSEAARVTALALDGVYLQREYRRYYPLGAAAAHVLGFTNVDGAGLEGLELALDERLRGADGSRIEIRDLRGAPVESVAAHPVRNGGDTRLSLDARLQKLAYDHLLRGVVKHRAAGGSIVLMDVVSGEVLAMATAPGFNPNNLKDYSPEVFRNRAVTDVFEPGSSIKTFTLGAALHAGVVEPDFEVNTSPGRIRIGSHTINDVRDFGRLTVSGVLVKSSNVGIVKIAGKFAPGVLQQTLDTFGFGRSTASGLPGEVGGHLPRDTRLRPIEHASLAFGYGMSVTALQLTRAYAALANDGVMAPVSLLRRDAPVAGERVMEAPLARRLRAIMEEVVTGGTAKKARIKSYRVAAKTGTVWKYTGGSYDKNRYIAVLVGFAPASRPRLALSVVVDDPRGGAYYGGLVAGPIFRDVMSQALRFLDVPPDKLPLQAAGAKAGAAVADGKRPIVPPHGAGA